MPGLNRTQILFIAGAAALTTAMYYAPRKAKPSKTANENTVASRVFDFNELLKYQEKNLTETERVKSESWLAELNQSGSDEDLNLYDSLAKIWDSKKMFALSAYYYEQKAGKDKSEKSLINAAYRYFDAYKVAIDSAVRAAMAEKAISNYSKVTELNPANLDAKTDLGILYAESTPEPMKGIMMLREVVTGNPNHENAQLNLGFLSMKSGQFEKAIERFDKVLEINPGHIDVYLYKAQALEKSGNIPKAIENLDHYRQQTESPEMKKQAEDYILKLQKK